ncbi:MAG: glutathione peroxidase [Flavobacteriaceae bacterium TMED265]|nr:MAG: glutathione peroxidase [Flavobacteriaceae bacterium TMED265]
MNWLSNAKSSLQKVAQQKSISPAMPIYEIEINALDGNPMDLSNFKGKFILVVNVASKCGFTSQYKELRKLQEQFSSELVIIGCPCNQFGGQEPGGSEEIQAFCSSNYDVNFPLTQKLRVKGSKQHALYAWLTKKELNGVKDFSILWNFYKFLISPEGVLLKLYKSTTSPLDKSIVSLIS